MTDFNSASFYGDESADLRGPRGLQGEQGEQGDLGPRGEPGPGYRYRFATFAVMGIQGGEIIMDHLIAEPCVLAEARADCGVPPVDPPWIATLAKNDQAIGTVSIDGAGKATITFLQGLKVPFAPGDNFSVVAPSIPDEEIGRVRMTFIADLPALSDTINGPIA